MANTRSLKGEVAIVGVGESDIGKVPHLSGLGLNAQASTAQLRASELFGPTILVDVTHGAVLDSALLSE